MKALQSTYDARKFLINKNPFENHTVSSQVSSGVVAMWLHGNQRAAIIGTKGMGRLLIAID
jgi:hypothetical protein